MNRTLKAIAAIMLMMVFAVGCTKPEGPNNGGNNNGQNDSIVNPNNGGGNNSVVDNSGSHNGHDYVDLGLPSGTLWATCNVGATVPEGYGRYFAWGEINTKYSYTWKSYMFSSGDSDRLTKYCSSPNYGYQGFTDTLKVLKGSDDIAAQWGYRWHTPTRQECLELYQNTEVTWTNRNGVNGRLYTASNGNSIFLPAAGVKVENEVNYSNSQGYYWSSSLTTEFPVYSWVLYVGSDECSVFGYNRPDGVSVRPVRSPN